MLQVTLIPNRSDRPRYARYVTYLRRYDTVVPLGHRHDVATGAVSFKEIPWSALSESRCDGEFESDWRAHVKTEAQRCSHPVPECTHPTAPLHHLRAAKIATGLIKPATTKRWARSLKAVRG